MVAVRTTIGAALALLVATASALGTNYEHDAKTTYCWAIPRATKLTNLTEADRTTAYSTRAECPMTMTLSLKPADTVDAFYQVNVTWTVQVDFSGGNAINNTRLYYGPSSTDPDRTAQIVHSNVHSCIFGTGCDPFSDGKQLVDKTVNKIANFTDNQATFSDSLRFPEPGEYSVLAHIILPDYNASSRFDYAVYTKLTVLAASAPTAAPLTTAPIQTAATPTATTSTKSSSGISQGATIAIIVGAVVVVAVLGVIVVLLRRRRDNHKTAGCTPAPVDEAGTNVRPSGPNGTQQLVATDTNSTSGFESAWGGTNNQRSLSVDKDAYQTPYAPPRPSIPRPSGELNQFSSSMHQPEMSASEYFGRPSQNPRKKRVDSDIEL